MTIKTVNFKWNQSDLQPLRDTVGPSPKPMPREGQWQYEEENIATLKIVMLQRQNKPEVLVSAVTKAKRKLLKTTEAVPIDGSSVQTGQPRLKLSRGSYGPTYLSFRSDLCKPKARLFTTVYS